MPISRSLVTFVLVLGACNNGGGTMTTDPTVRCMTQCTRVNTLCMASTDCTSFCDPVGAVYTFCDEQVDTFLDCVEDQSDSAFCTGTNPCGTQMNTLDACISANTDAGSGDAGARDGS